MGPWQAEKSLIDNPWTRRHGLIGEMEAWAARGCLLCLCSEGFFLWGVCAWKFLEGLFFFW